jgi:hypothetical protein
LQASATTATVWVGAINENFDPARIALRRNGQPVPLDPLDWQHWPSQGERRIHFQRVLIDSLPPNSSHALECVVSNAVKSTAKVTTLPDRVPMVGDPRPFIVMLGSCFYQPNDHGRAGRVFRRLPAAARPDVKLLCGDQVYLDNPWYQFFFFPYGRNRLEKIFLDKYLKNWTAESDGEGYREVLKSGANYFSPDDHEYWNNAPTPASYVMTTWTEGGREQWLAACKPLYQIFQNPDLTREFAIGNLSFFLADARSARTADRTDFIDPAEFEKLRRWVANLNGPGVLALGQVIFAGQSSGIGGRLGDYGLPDFKQYEELVKTLLSAKHSILLLTGDVHFGGVARCTLPSGAELIQVISSPMSLVSDLGGQASNPPEKFPAFAISGVLPVGIDQSPERLFTLEGNHFATLEFLARGAKILVTIKYWMIREDENVSLSYTLSEIQLQ